MQSNVKVVKVRQTGGIWLNPKVVLNLCMLKPGDAVKIAFYKDKFVAEKTAVIETKTEKVETA